MRYIYNCVKLVLLIACLGFAGQTSATRARAVELGGLLFDMNSGTLQVSATDKCKTLIRESLVKNVTNGSFVKNCNFFSIYFKENFELKQQKPSEEDKGNSDVCYKGEFLKDLLIWSANCFKGEDHEKFDEETECYPVIKVEFDHHAMSREISTLFTQGEFKSKTYGVTFAKDSKSAVTVKTLSGESMKLANWIDSVLSSIQPCRPYGQCRHRHRLDIEAEEFDPLPVFVDLSTLTDVLAPVVDALQNSTKGDAEENQDEDFGGFADLFS